MLDACEIERVGLLYITTSKIGDYLVQDDLKLPNDSEKVPKLNGVVGGSIPNREVVSLLDRKRARWLNTSCVPEKKKEKKEKYWRLLISN